MSLLITTHVVYCQRCLTAASVTMACSLLHRHSIMSAAVAARSIFGRGGLK